MRKSKLIDVVIGCGTCGKPLTVVNEHGMFCEDLHGYQESIRAKELLTPFIAKAARSCETREMTLCLARPWTNSPRHLPRPKRGTLQMKSVYGKAASMGYPFIRGHGKEINGVWCGRFTKDCSGKGPALWLGYDDAKKRWVSEREKGGRNE